MFGSHWFTSALSRTQAFERHRAFSEGREIVENLPYGVTYTCNCEKIDFFYYIFLKYKYLRICPESFKSIRTKLAEI